MRKSKNQISMDNQKSKSKNLMKPGGVCQSGIVIQLITNLIY